MTVAVPVFRSVLWLARRMPEIVEGSLPLSSSARSGLEERLRTASEQGDGLLPAVEHALSLLSMEPRAWEGGIDAARLPAIGVHDHAGAFIVHHQLADGGWLIEDPDGRRHITLLPEGASYRSIDTAQSAAGHVHRTAGEMFRGVLRQNRRFFIQATVASVIINLLALLTSLYSMQVYDRVIPTQGLSTLYALTVGITIGIVLELVGKFARSSILDHAVQSMDTDLSHGIFERLLRIRMDQFPASVGTLSAQLRSYEMIRSFASSITLYLLVDTPFAIFFLIVIYLLGGPVVAAVPVVFFVVALCVGFIFRGGMERHARSSMASSNRKLGLLVEAVEGAESIKSTGAGWQFLARWNGLTRLNISEDMKLRHLGESASYYAAFLQQISYVLLVAAGAYVASTSTALTSGGLIACSILSGRVLTPVGMLPGLMVQWANARSAMSSIASIFKLEQDNQDVQRPMAIDRLRGDISFRDIEFAYRGQPSALRVQTLDIRAGERIGLLGAVGSGKSTLLKLTSGMYMPAKGRVSVDGIDLQHISRAHLSDRLGYLPQDVRLFSGTLRDNLMVGSVGKTEEQLLAACDLTGLSHVVKAHPKGFDLPIAEGGSGVSGGQRQLIGLTRMVLARPDVWLLDEPTAAMDEGLEMRAIAALRQSIGPTQTLVVVTHKPALLQLVDRLVILSAGEIMMDGPKAQVLQQLARNRAVAAVPPAASPSDAQATQSASREAA